MVLYWRGTDFCQMNCARAVKFGGGVVVESNLISTARTDFPEPVQKCVFSLYKARHINVVFTYMCMFFSSTIPAP